MKKLHLPLISQEELDASDITMRKALYTAVISILSGSLGVLLIFAIFLLSACAQVEPEKPFTVEGVIPFEGSMIYRD